MIKEYETRIDLEKPTTGLWLKIEPTMCFAEFRGYVKGFRVTVMEGYKQVDTSNISVTPTFTIKKHKKALKRGYKLINKINERRAHLAIPVEEVK